MMSKTGYSRPLFSRTRVVSLPRRFCSRGTHFSYSLSLSPFFTSPVLPLFLLIPLPTPTPPPAGGPRSRGLTGWRRRRGEARWRHDRDGAACAPLQPGGRSRPSSGAEQMWRAELQEQGARRRPDPVGPHPASPCGSAGHRRGRTPSGRG
jgi:hypothetical protein